MESIDSEYSKWIAKLKTELKDRDLGSFDYIWDGVHISPFEEKKFEIANRFPRFQSGWNIGAECKPENASILHALEFGAQLIKIKHLDKSINLIKLFKNVRLDWINTMIDIDDPEILDLYIQYLKKNKYSSSEGVLIYADFHSKLFSKIINIIPIYKLLSIDLHEYQSAKEIAAAWRTLIEKIDSFSNDTPIDTLFSSVNINYHAGQDFVLNIAMIKSIRMIWMHVLKSFGVETTLPVQISSFVKNSSDKVSDNMILSSIAAVALVSAGIDALFVEVPDAKKIKNAWNIKLQHILKEEGGFDKMEDPMAGAWVVERLAGVIGERVWGMIE